MTLQPETGYGSSYSGLEFAKPEPRPVAKSKRQAIQRLIDERESALVRRRSRGVCELPGCREKAEHVHHLLGGNGRRGRGESAQASHKVHICSEDHRQIHDHRIRLSWDESDPFGTLRVQR